MSGFESIAKVKSGLLLYKNDLDLLSLAVNCYLEMPQERPTDNKKALRFLVRA
jgi:hypothetical protein